MVDVHVAEPVTASLRRVSWGAILAGVAIALIVQLMLTLLGVAIGLATVDPATGDSPDAGALSIGTALWWAISGIVAAFLGGWVSARLAGMPSSMGGMLHGLATWAVSMLIVFLLISSALGAVIGGGFRVLAGAGEVVGEAAGAAAPALAEAAGGPLDPVLQEARATVAGDDRTAGGEALGGALTRVFTAGEEGAPAARQIAIDLLVRQAGMTPEQADAQITAWEQSFDETAAQAEVAAREAAEAAAEATAMAAIYAFIAMALGALAGAFGGRSGTPKSLTMLHT